MVTSWCPFVLFTHEIVSTLVRTQRSMDFFKLCFKVFYLPFLNIFCILLLSNVFSRILKLCLTMWRCEYIAIAMSWWRLLWQPLNCYLVVPFGGGGHVTSVCTSYFLLINVYCPEVFIIASNYTNKVNRNPDKNWRHTNSHNIKS